MAPPHMLAILCLLNCGALLVMSTPQKNWRSADRILFPEQIEYLQNQLRICPSEDLVLWTDGRCYKEYEQGPCYPGRAIVFDRKLLRPYCEDRWWYMQRTAYRPPVDWCLWLVWDGSSDGGSGVIVSTKVSRGRKIKKVSVSAFPLKRTHYKTDFLFILGCMWAVYTFRCERRVLVISLLSSINALKYKIIYKLCVIWCNRLSAICVVTIVYSTFRAF